MSICGDHNIHRLPSSPRLNLADNTQRIHATPGQEALQEQLLAITRNIIANTEDVGDGLAEEARRMHYKETEERGIRGITTAQERMELAEEGIDVLALPAPHMNKQSLQ